MSAKHALKRPCDHLMCGQIGQCTAWCSTSSLHGYTCHPGCKCGSTSVGVLSWHSLLGRRQYSDDLCLASPPKLESARTYRSHFFPFDGGACGRRRQSLGRCSLPESQGAVGWPTGLLSCVGTTGLPSLACTRTPATTRTSTTLAAQAATRHAIVSYSCIPPTLQRIISDWPGAPDRGLFSVGVRSFARLSA